MRYVRELGCVCLVGLVTQLATIATAADVDPLVEQSAAALRKAVGYLTDNVATEGGYLYNYSLDLQRRAGENNAPAKTVWVQPPGTPAVGDALLTAYQRTGDKYYLEHARRAANCLIRGQLESGGWANQIDFDPADRKKWAYRVDGTPSSKARNSTTLDDNKTQSAIRFLMRLDRELSFSDAAVHEAALYALDKLVKAQYANGAWPQQFDRAADPSHHAPRKASYPESWSREFPKEKYTERYTFNDNAMADAINVMLLAYEIYGDSRYLESAKRCGDFILLAQMPAPQPAWAQQYNFDMHPAWARKFEPPSITAGESQSLITALITLYEQTGEKRFLEPVPSALAYLKTCVLPDGRLPRFLELQTNRPLYFTKDYRLTYDDSDVPTHYSFKVESKLDQLEARYQQALALKPDQLKRPLLASNPPRMSGSVRRKAQEAVAALDDQGRWVVKGRIGDLPDVEPVLSMRTYVMNIRALSDFLGAARAQAK